MQDKPKATDSSAELRLRAEKRMKSRKAQRPSNEEPDNSRLVHELEVHQIELEMQNTELGTARNEAESLLEKYTDLYDFAPVGYFTLAPDGKILLVNLTGSALVGSARGLIVGRSFLHLVSPEQRPSLARFLKHVFAGAPERSIELGLLRAGKPPRPVNIEARRSPDGLECRIVLMDITERMENEEILRRNQALFSAVIEQAPVGVYVIDAAFRLQQANPAALELFAGIDPLIARDFSEIIHILWPPRVAARATARFRHTLKTGEPYQSPEFAEKRRDTGANEVYEWQIRRVTLPAGDSGVVCFFSNITERRNAEMAQRRLDVLTATNLRLKDEIIRRLAIEER